MRYVNFVLIRQMILPVILTGYLLSAAILPARAQDAVPVTAVETEELGQDVRDVLSQGPVVIELFSSQACVFCPQADRFFADLAQQPNVIGLSCHVDYFDVRVGALSQPFCSARQNWYMQVLHAGPNYTPQMVVQGVHDVPGNKIPDVIGVLKKAASAIPPVITMNYAGQPGHYRLRLQALPPAAQRDYQLSLLVYDTPHDLVVAEGRNRGQKMSYENIVSAMQDIGTWGGTEDEMEITIDRKKTQRGFVVLAQDIQTGAIAAAGRYAFGQQNAPDTMSSPASEGYNQ